MRRVGARYDLAPDLAGNTLEHEVRRGALGGGHRTIERPQRRHRRAIRQRRTQQQHVDAGRSAGREPSLVLPLPLVKSNRAKSRLANSSRIASTWRTAPGDRSLCAGSCPT
jgi:hypothetical protein